MLGGQHFHRAFYTYIYIYLCIYVFNTYILCVGVLCPSFALEQVKKYLLSIGLHLSHCGRKRMVAVTQVVER